MTHALLAFLSRPVRAYTFGQRLLAGAILGALALGAPALLLVLVTLLGGRFQASRGVEQDMWLTSAVYPVGAAIAGALALAFGPLVRRAWQASLLGVVSLMPFFALLSLADEPHGASAYRVRWPLAVLGAVLLGAPVGALIFRGSAGGRRKGRHRGAAG